MPRLDALGRDLRFAIRLMRQTPIVSGVAMLSLALGIGANVAIFSLVNALMLKALPIHEPERLVNIQQVSSSPTAQPSSSFTYPQWEYLRDHQDFLAGLLATSNGRFNLNASGELRPVNGVWVDGHFFEVLGITAVGRRRAREPGLGAGARRRPAGSTGGRRPGGRARAGAGGG